MTERFRTLTYGSVCSGIEAATAAWHPLGWQPAFFSEIEPFPCRVLERHYPNVPNHGDMTNFKDWPDETIDILVGGTPCQSFSIAGLRKGLDDPRGNLMLTFGAVAKRYRPRIVAWENVPGVLSSNGGRDFGTFLGMLAELGYGFAYRVFDAQYVRVDGFARAVPQRRRRVFVVGYLGDWQRAAAVLFESESLSGNSPPCRETGQGAALTISARTQGGGGLGTDFDCDGGLIPSVANPLTARMHKGINTTMDEGQTMIAFDCKGTQVQTIDDGSNPTLRAMSHANSHQNVGGQLAVAFDMRGRDGGAMPEGSYDTANIRAANGGSSRSYVITQGGGIAHASKTKADTIALLHGVREALGEEAFAKWGLGILDSLQSPEVLRQALHGSELRPAAFSRRWVVYCALSREEAGAEGALQSMRESECNGRAPQRWEPSEQRSIKLGTYLSELSQPGACAERLMQDLWEASEGFGAMRQALSAVQEVRRSSPGKVEPAHADWAVRRLTTEECEFLQGFPRGYTDVPPRNKNHTPDGPRYKALGNSMAVNVMRWLGRRIEAVETLR